MTQLDAFSQPPAHPRARSTDARSSHEAAARLERSGADRLQAERVLAALKKYPNSTSRELAQSARLDRYEVARRLPELHAEHKVGRYEPSSITAPCAVSGKRVIRWCAI